MSATDVPALSLSHSSKLSGLRGVLHFADSPLGALTQAFQQHGTAVSFGQLRQSYLLLSEPTFIEQILLGKKDDFCKDSFTQDLRALLGMGLLTNEGDDWKKQRKLIAPAFQPREMAGYAAGIVDCADRSVARLRHARELDLHAEMMRFALDAVVSALFGAECERFGEVESSLSAATELYERLWHTWRALLPRWLPLGVFSGIRRARLKLDEVLLELIALKRRTPGRDLVSNLIAATDDAGHGLSDAQLRDEAMTLFLAGHETTALTLTYTFYLLSQNPGAYDRLLAEVDGVLGSEPPTAARLADLPYLSAVIRESLRLYPPAWAIGRQTLREVAIGGINVAAGTQVIMSPWVVQRDPRWFHEPGRFSPERWLSAEPAALPRFAYFPFGGGPRVCVGQHFALLEAALCIARLSQSVRLSRDPSEELELSPVITLRPRGAVRFSVAPRAVT